MVYNSRMLALVISICISVLTAFVLFFLTDTSLTVILTTTSITVIGSFLLLFIFLDKLFFREIKRIQNLLGAGQNSNPLEPPKNNEADNINPLVSIYERIALFADQKQKEIDELKKLEAFRKEFIADVSHELKTPIFAAQGFVHTLLDGAVNDKAVRSKFLKKAAKSLDGLDMLVHDLLILSQIETGQIKMRFEEFDIYQLAEEVLEQFESKTDKKDIRLKINSESRQVMVFADRQRIGQVLTNLVSNAIKHSDEGNEVVVSFEIKKKSVVTKVQDFGEGIPEEHLPRIFERFYRVDKSRSREKGGTGLGLAIVKHILEGHDTKPHVQSTPGKGSVFSFKLPRHNHEQPDGF